MMDEMTIEDIKRCLCSLDPRNPDNMRDIYEEGECPEPRSGKCGCDNCFYGRDRLARLLADILVEPPETFGGTAQAAILRNILLNIAYRHVASGVCTEDLTNLLRRADAGDIQLYPPEARALRTILRRLEYVMHNALAERSDASEIQEAPV